MDRYTQTSRYTYNDNFGRCERKVCGERKTEARRIDGKGTKPRPRERMSCRLEGVVDACAVPRSGLPAPLGPPLRLPTAVFPPPRGATPSTLLFSPFICFSLPAAVLGFVCVFHHRFPYFLFLPHYSARLATPRAPRPPLSNPFYRRRGSRLVALPPPRVSARHRPCEPNPPLRLTVSPPFGTVLIVRARHAPTE